MHDTVIVSIIIFKEGQRLEKKSTNSKNALRAVAFLPLPAGGFEK